MAQRRGRISVPKLPLTKGAIGGWRLACQLSLRASPGQKVHCSLAVKHKTSKLLRNPNFLRIWAHLSPGQDLLQFSRMAPLGLWCLFVSGEPVLSQGSQSCCLLALLCPPSLFLSSWPAIQLGQCQAGNSAADTRYVTQRGAGKERVCEESALPPGVLWCSLLSASGSKEQEMVEVHKDLSHFCKHTPDFQMFPIWTFPGEARRAVQPQLVFLPCRPSCSDGWASPCISIHVKLIPWRGP